MAVEPAAEVPAEGAALTGRPEPEPARTPLPRSFYARPSLTVARDLLGRELVRLLDGSVLVARIVESEAYREDDPASHSYRGRTTRTEVMFGPPGHLYVYFTYGMHFCMNVVTGGDGEGSAVLLRAAEPVEGVPEMRRRRGTSGLQDLCRGPARLTQALGIGGAHNGIDLVLGTDLFVAAGRPPPIDRVGSSPRVGIRVATERPWRLFEEGNPFVSRSPSGRIGRAGGSASGSGRGEGRG